MATLDRPEFRTLDTSDVDALLARNNVGRLAFIDDEGEVDIRPLHYVYWNRKIYGRTAPDARFCRDQDLPMRVAFEVDEVEAVFRWKSVIVRGEFTHVSPEAEAEEWKEAVRRLRLVVKRTLTNGDPVPDRSVIFRITVERATGRASY